MKDTIPAVERKFQNMLMGRSGEARLKMGCSMHATAQALAKASLSRRYPRARPTEFKRFLFLHFYGGDFTNQERDRIASALARRRPMGRRREAENREKREPLAAQKIVAGQAAKTAAVAESRAGYGKKKGRSKRSRLF